MGWKEVLKPGKKNIPVALAVFFVLFSFVPLPYEVITPPGGWEFISGPFPYRPAGYYKPLDVFYLTYLWLFLEAVGAYFISCLILPARNRLP